MEPQKTNPTTLQKIIIVSLLFFLVFSIPAKSQRDSLWVQHQKDSLLQVINRTEKKEKIAAYSDLIFLLYAYDKQKDSVLMYSNILEKEAIKIGDIDIEAKTKSNTLIILNSAGRNEDVIKKGDEVLAFLAKNEKWTLYYKTLDTIISSYMNSGKKEKAMDYAEKEYVKAKKRGNKGDIWNIMYSIGNLYAESDRPEEAKIWYKDILESAKDEKEIPEIKLFAYGGLVNALLVMHNTKEAEPAFKGWKKDLDTYIRQQGDSIFTIARLDSYYQRRVKYYIETQEFDKALEASFLAEKLYPGRSISPFIAHNRSIAYLRTGQYKKALEENEKAYNDAVKKGSEQNIIVALRFGAIIQAYLGNAEEAERLFEESAGKQYELAQENFNDQLNELRTQYEMDKLVAEKKIRNQQLIIAVVACSLLLVILLIYIIYSRRLKRKNLSLYNQIQDSVRMEKGAERALELIPEAELSREIILFKELNRRMHSENLFLNPAIDRRQMASDLGTNEKYLSDAIHKGVGLSFAKYISDLRLAYSLQLLSKQPYMTLETVAEQSGHGSYMPFFSAFVRKYGMGPSDYRKFSVRNSDKNLSAN